MTPKYRCPHCLRLIGTMTVAGPSRVHVSPGSHRLAAPDAVLATGDLHPPRPDMWVTGFLADAH